MALEQPETARGTIPLPAPTPAPLVMALGVTLLLAGLVTNASVSTVGLVLLTAGAVGWFREVLPHEQEESVAIEPPVAAIVPSRRAPHLQRIVNGWRLWCATIDSSRLQTSATFRLSFQAASASRC